MAGCAGGVEGIQHPLNSLFVHPASIVGDGDGQTIRWLILHDGQPDASGAGLDRVLQDVQYV